ncbi:6868_t:CDS:2 [Diversispora eburnea]|uniref:6868_t:CDS:1 n=1 Tax=Diversispora eburnea TaxID=1213867 RepID=A0A9N8V6P5_9GLOM|nr:6868_t:CDS:2 [Diversispora eburnea]
MEGNSPRIYTKLDKQTNAQDIIRTNDYPYTPSENGDQYFNNNKRLSRWRISEAPQEILNMIASSTSVPPTKIPNMPVTNIQNIPTPNIHSMPVTPSNSMVGHIMIYEMYQQDPQLLPTKIDKKQPPPPLIPFEELMTKIQSLGLQFDVLDVIDRPNITWKGSEINVESFPHYEVLHKAEAKACGILRLMPDVYLNAKFLILAAAKGYKERNIPFRKVDAQKLVRIDVNKACKLWEFFKQADWI